MNIETKILFDPRTADFSANQILRMDALGEEVPTSEERLVYATVRDSTRTTESLLNDIETQKIADKAIIFFRINQTISMKFPCGECSRIRSRDCRTTRT